MAKDQGSNVVNGPCCGESWPVPQSIIAFKWFRSHCYRWSEIRWRWVYSHDALVQYEKDRKHDSQINPKD